MRKRPVLFNGKNYPSMTIAARETGLSVYTIWTAVHKTGGVYVPRKAGRQKKATPKEPQPCGQIRVGKFVL